MTDLEYLFSLEVHGIKLGLENIRRLLEQAGRPQDRYPTVHVAGTNGKGSVVAMLDAMLRAAGLRVGRFTSPHLIDVAERFIVDGRPMPADALEEHLAFFRRAADALEHPPTFFEMNTAIAFRWFDVRKVDAAIVEVGMGGRLDSTNVISPLAVAVTNIDLEHTRYLGDTVSKIAFEKAGVIKAGVPLVTGETHEEALRVLLNRAHVLGCPAHAIGQDFAFDVSGPPFAQRFTYRSEHGPRVGRHIEDVPLALAGDYQGANAAVAVTLARLLEAHFPRVDEGAIAAGLSSARWPCRMEVVLERPRVIVDVAHNPAGARKLAAQLEDCVCVLAVSSDKDAAGMIEALAPKCRALILTQFHGSRALPAEQLERAAAAHPRHRTIPDLEDAIAAGIDRARENGPLLITGSIFFAGEARALLTRRYGAPPLEF